MKQTKHTKIAKSAESNVATTTGAAQEQTEKKPPPSPPPPKGPSLAVIFALLIVAVVMLAVGTKWGSTIQSGLSNLWAMVVPSSSRDKAANEADDDSAGLQFYTCGMHPWVILPNPGSCPICQMDLTPIDPDKFSGEITIDPVITQNIGVRIEPVKSGPLVRTIRTVGTVDYDETTVRDISMKVEGWIEKLYVDYLGVEVAEGQALFEYYSPDLYAAQDEFLLAYRNKSRIAAEFVPQAAQGAQDLLEAARTRLEYFDVSPQQIEELIAAGVPSKTMTMHSPHKGVVIAKHANEGMRVDTGMQVYRIADLSKLWVMVTLYEYQLPYVQVGQRAVMSLPYIPGQTFEGEVIYIYPYLDKKTRQINVRLEFDNPNGVLKPGMYTNVELKNTLARDRTLAPRAAIIDTGERQVAFVSLGEGKFEPRDVRTGIETDEGMVEILDGLRPGELVVTSGQFLLDSEANIREGLAKFVRGNLASEQETVVAVAGASELSSLPAQAVEALGQILDAYFAIGDTLTRDSTDGISSDARALAQGVDRLLKIALPDDEHFWRRHDEVATIRGKSLELIDQSDIEQARLAFADLSIALSKLTRATGIPPAYSTEVHELHCPMFREGQGGNIWLQPKGGVRNPFFGSKMLECFDERIVLPTTGATSRPDDDPPSAQDKPAPSPPSQQRRAKPGLDVNAQENLDQLVSAYLSIHETLTRDETTGITASLGVIHAAAMVLANVEDEFVRGAANTIMKAANESAEDIDATRAVFERVSEALLQLASVVGPSETAAPTLYQVYCPMVKKNWLQATNEVANPYAPSMLRCGIVKGTISADNTKASNP